MCFFEKNISIPRGTLYQRRRVTANARRVCTAHNTRSDRRIADLHASRDTEAAIRFRARGYTSRAYSFCFAAKENCGPVKRRLREGCDIIVFRLDLDL